MWTGMYKCKASFSQELQDDSQGGWDGWGM